MYAPVYPPSVVASVSYCALPLCLPAFGGDMLFKCYFYPNTKRGLARDGPTCTAALCQAASAMFGRKIRLCVGFINTWRKLSGMTLVSLCKAFHNHRKLSNHYDQTPMQMKVHFSSLTNPELHCCGVSARTLGSHYDG